MKYIIPGLEKAKLYKHVKNISGYDIENISEIICGLGECEGSIINDSHASAPEKQIGINMLNKDDQKLFDNVREAKNHLYELYVSLTKQ